MTEFEFLVRLVILTPALAVVVWCLLRLDTGDEELHHAAAEERRRRQRERWTQDGRTVR